jgi:hypothetical protein
MLTDLKDCNEQPESSGDGKFYFLPITYEYMMVTSQTYCRMDFCAQRGGKCLREEPEASRGPHGKTRP